MMKMRLESSGYDVATAFNGEDGLAKAREIKPDIVLLDVMMPVMDGFAVLRHLYNGQATRNIPVIMMTVKGETKDILKAQEIGAMDYIIKPFNSEELLKLIDKYT